MKLQRFYFALLIALFLASCIESNGDELKPPAGGDADEIIVVVDSTVWAGVVGDELRSTLGAPMLGMPQDEPLFNLYKVNPKKLNPVLKSAHNMIFITTLDSESSQSRTLREMFTDESLKSIRDDTTRYQMTASDTYARGQKVLHLFGRNEQELARRIAESSQGITAYFEAHARQITQDRIFSQRARDIESVLTENHGYAIQVPYGYELAKDHLDFVWFRELGLQKEKNIFIFEQPYTGTNVFNEIEALRNRITELHLRDIQKPHLYIQLQDIIPVFSKQINFNDKFAMESRGLWAVSDLSAGGPFLSYTFVDEENQILYYIEGYVFHAAGKKKRLMREMDAILATFRTPSEIN